MTIVAKQYNEIFNKHYSGVYGDIIVRDDVVFKLCKEVSTAIITECMYRKPLKPDELPESYDKDLDEYAYTVDGMLEWTTAKITTVTDEMVDYDGSNPEAMRDTVHMLTSLREDMGVYTKLCALITLEVNNRKHISRDNTDSYREEDTHEQDSYTGEAR